MIPLNIRDETSLFGNRRSRRFPGDVSVREHRPHMHFFSTPIFRRLQFRRFARTICWLAAPAAVFLLIWLPIVLHYRVPEIEVSSNDVAAARRFPSDDVLSELRDLSILPGYFPDDRQVVSSADRLLRGELNIPGRPAVPVRLPFDPRDLEVSPYSYLPVAGFVIPGILLRAYAITGRDEFFQTARQNIIRFAEYDRSVWLPRGLQWNDHAIASRVPVLAEFWRLYRHRVDFRPDEARIVLQLAERMGFMLANPKRFTAATNHGIMQNVALLHLRLAFPGLPNCAMYDALAYDRLREQMRFYINSEGVVLEHSAGYQGMGVELLGRALRFFSLLNRPVPSDWTEKYERAKHVYSQLRRPDGTLPVFGDTDGASQDPGPHITHFDAGGRAGRLTHQLWPPANSGSVLYPVAGYAISWECPVDTAGRKVASQTVSLWSYFPGHAHKIADELSVVLWAAGRTWWANTGYWPYDLPGRDSAESWDASNAPHFEGESAGAARTSRLVSYADSSLLNFLELERTTGRQSIRRQVVHVKPSVWIVVDNPVSEDSTGMISIWTPHPSLSVKRQPGESYTLWPEEGRPVLRVHFLPSENAKTLLRHGSLRPFGGWMVLGGIPRPAFAVVNLVPVNAWSVAVWSIDEPAPQQVEPAPQVTEWAGPERWSIEVPQRAGVVRLHRRQATLTITGDRGGQGVLDLQAAPDVSDERRVLAASFQAIVRHYPQFREALDFRYRNSWRLLLLMILQEVFFLVYESIGGRWRLRLRVLSSVAWLIGGLWLYRSYLL
jgi:hypothetical protein